jgi:hypothetical protein
VLVVTLAGNFSQTRNVRYRACNAAGACATATLHVRVG